MTVKVVLAPGVRVAAPGLPTVKSLLLGPLLPIPSPLRAPVPRFLTVKVKSLDALPTWMLPRSRLALPSSKSVPAGCSTAISGTKAGPMTMEKSCVASGAVPLDAVIVPLNVPVVPGVPEITPPVLSVRGGGRAPEDTVKVIGVVPDAVQVWL